MTTNEVLMRHNFINKILFKDGDSSLDKSLKVKLMGMRIDYGKVRKQLDEDLKEFTNGLTTEEIKALAAKPDKTPEEQKELEDWNKQFNEEYNAYIDKRLAKETDLSKISLTEDEYNQIVEVNAGNDVEINGTKLNAPDFLEVIYSLFVE